MFPIEIEIIPNNTPAKIFFDSHLLQTWLTEVLFKGLIQDHYEAAVVAASNMKAFQDVKNLFYWARGTKGYVAVRPQRSSQTIRGHTTAVIVKKVVELIEDTETEKKIEKKKVVKEIQELEALEDLRYAYLIMSITKAIQLHTQRIVERHFILP